MGVTTGRLSPWSFGPVWTLATVVGVLRQWLADRAMFESIWAEDGWMLLCSRERGIGRCLLEPVNGYWPVFHRVYSELVSVLPPSLWPVILPISGAALTALLPVALSRVTNHVEVAALRGVIVFSPVLLPALGLEFINVVGNVHWTMLLFAILFLLGVDPMVPARRGELVVLFLGGISGPVGFATIVAVLGVSIAHRAGLRSALGRLLAAGSGFGIQASMVLRHRGDDRLGSSLERQTKFEYFVNDVLGVVPGLNATRQVPVSFLSYSSTLTPILLSVVVVGVSVLLLLKAERPFVRLGGVLSCTASVVAIFLLVTIDPNPRYEFVVGLLFAISVLYILAASDLRSVGKLAAAIMLLILWTPSFRAGPFRTEPSDVRWSEQLDVARTACNAGARSVLFHFAPERFLETPVSCDVVADFD